MEDYLFRIQAAQPLNSFRHQHKLSFKEIWKHLQVTQQSCHGTIII